MATRVTDGARRERHAPDLFNHEYDYQLIIKITIFVICSAFLKIKRKKFRELFADNERQKAIQVGAWDGAYCPIT